jgi:hypothetical protein
VSKSTRNTGKTWTMAEVRERGRLAPGNTPTRVIGLKLGRTPAAIYARAAQKGISLGTPNGRRVR